MADFVVILDATIVNIALPSIGRSLHVSAAGLSWVISAYILAFGGLLMLGGRLADLFGRRRLFIIGLIVFGIASLAGGLSTSIGVLIVFRALQGVGAAMLAPAARSIVVTLFDEGPERSKALGVWAAVAGSGSVVGLILGGVLTSALGWQWVLFVNIPIAVVAVALTPFLISESRNESSDRSIDFVGAALVTGGLASALYAVVDANNAGWGSIETVGLLGLGVILLAAFVWVENKVASPLVPLRIFKGGQVRGANIAMMLMSAAMVGMFFVLTLYLQNVLGYSALRAGLSTLPLGLVLITVAGLSGPVTQRIGAKPVLLTGLATLTIGIGWLSRIPIHGAYLTDILGPSLIIGIGLALTFVSLTIASVSGIEADLSGVAGALINMTQAVGGAIGLAVIATVSASHVHVAVSNVVAVDNGFRAALVVAAGISAVSVAIAAVVLPGRSRTTADSGAVVPTSLVIIPATIAAS
jgi:EmrB/QacA subfamily drug resistance transporter